MTRLIGLIFSLLIYISATAQENSPYSRYGMGDIAPSQNIINRGMGGIAAGYSDFTSVNFINPASYGNLGYVEPAVVRTNPGYQRSTIFDIGAEIDSRTLKGGTPVTSYTANNLVISYLQLAFPIKLKKANKKGIFLGGNIGLRPVSKVNYKIASISRLAGVDSLGTTYEGTGGLSEVYTGAGIRIKNLSVGFNAGYTFGNRDFSTKVDFLNDSIAHYASNSTNKTNYGGTFVHGGLQYEFFLKSKAVLRLGAYGQLKQSLKGTQEISRQTIGADYNGNDYTIDSVYKNSQSGTVNLPSSYGVGFTYRDSAGRWTIGADYEATQWDKYRFFGQPDAVANNWKIRAGVEYFPATYNTPVNKYFNFVRYRFGFNYGPDYIKVNNNLPAYGFSFGAGFPLKLRRGFYETQTSMLNTAIEIGSRGDKTSSLRESTVRISFGLSLGDLWFRRYKYD